MPYGRDVLIRVRSESDVPACVAMMRRTHELDGYPRYWRSDPAAFLRGRAETAAYVAVRDGGLVGHVALHSAEGDPALPVVQRATDRPAEQLAVVARLLVSPTARRGGVGQALLDRAVQHAHARDQLPVLNVLPEDVAPRTLYERAGWRPVGEVTLPIEGHDPLLVRVYLGPPPPAG
ncbi:MAG: putative GCN5-related N-acetyltransferase [Friedmanniella sp.]|nr:putative GCN5-related N-acetyltransferase [Friedmanniella sp.]